MYIKKILGCFCGQTQTARSNKKGRKKPFFVTLESEFKLENRYMHTNEVIGVFLWTSTFGVEVCGSSPPNSLWFLSYYVVPKFTRVPPSGGTRNPFGTSF